MNLNFVKELYGPYFGVTAFASGLAGLFRLPARQYIGYPGGQAAVRVARQENEAPGNSIGASLCRRYRILTAIGNKSGNRYLWLLQGSNPSGLRGRLPPVMADACAEALRGGDLSGPVVYYRAKAGAAGYCRYLK